MEIAVEGTTYSVEIDEVQEGIYDVNLEGETIGTAMKTESGWVNAEAGEMEYESLEALVEDLLLDWAQWQ